MVQRHRHSGGYILGHGGYILAHYIPVYGDHIMVQKCDRQLMEVICRSSKVIFGVAWLYSEDGGYSLGKDGVSKIDVFSEKFQTAFDPPPSFLENHVALFATKLRQKCVCSVWRDCCVLYDPISHEMHVVQQFNMVLPLNWLKTYPKKTLLYHFHAEKALFKVQNLQHKFLDWK